MSKPKGLGLGLDALLGDSMGADDVATVNALEMDPAIPPAKNVNAATPSGKKPETDSVVKPEAKGPVTSAPMENIQAGKYQPRQTFDDHAIDQLAQSIRQHGLIQPIVVRQVGPAGKNAKFPRYEIIAGERRFRASQKAGLADIPVIVRESNDEQTLALALIENIQRKDLNAIEEARAIARLLEEFKYSHDQAAQAIGRSRSATSNLLRLLNLTDLVQQFVVEGTLDMGHARALLPLPGADQIVMAQKIIDDGLSVRETEAMVITRLNGPEDGPGKKSKPAKSVQPDRDIQRLQMHLADTLATKVQIKPGPKGNGKLIIEYSDAENFEGLLQRMGLSTGAEH
ncbi:MAG: ParB/RepB/Spo0J family partition protein [Burkholderiaceae bacterium]